MRHRLNWLIALLAMAATVQMAAMAAARPQVPASPAADWSATPVADTWVARGGLGASAEYPPGPRGADAVLQTGFKDGGAVTRFALLRFDTSTLPADAAVSDARLSLYVLSASSHTCQNPSRPLTLTLQVVLDPWQESSLVGRDLPASARGGREIAVTEVLEEGDRRRVSFDVTDIVAFWQDQWQRFRAPALGVLVRSEPNCLSLGWAVQVASRESDQSPRLDVRYTTGAGTLTPVPSGTLTDLALAGQVVDGSAEDVKPIAWTRAYSFAREGRCSLSVPSDGDGRFMQECRGVDRSQRVELYLEAAWGYADQTHFYPLNAPGLVDGRLDVHIALEPTPYPTPVIDHPRTWRIHGTITGAQPSGHVPVVDAQVDLTGTYCRGPVYSDSAGAFEILCTPNSTLVTVQLHITAAGYVPYHQEWYLGSLLSGDFVLRPLGSASPSPTDAPSSTPTATATPRHAMFLPLLTAGTDRYSSTDSLDHRPPPLSGPHDHGRVAP